MNTERIFNFLIESRDKLIKVLLPLIIGYMVIYVFIIVSFSYMKGYTFSQEIFIIANLVILIIAIFMIIFIIYHLNNTNIISQEITNKINNKVKSHEYDINNSYEKINDSIKNLLSLANIFEHESTENIKILTSTFITECENYLSKFEEMLKRFKNNPPS